MYCAEVVRYKQEFIYAKTFTPRTIMIPWRWSMTHQPEPSWLEKRNASEEQEPFCHFSILWRSLGKWPWRHLEAWLWQLQPSAKRSQVPHTNTWKRPSANQAEGQTGNIIYTHTINTTNSSASYLPDSHRPCLKELSKESKENQHLPAGFPRKLFFLGLEWLPAIL